MAMPTTLAAIHEQVRQFSLNFRRGPASLRYLCIGREGETCPAERGHELHFHHIPRRLTPSDERGDDAQVDREGRAVAGVRARASIKGKPAPINYCIVVAGRDATARARSPVVRQVFCTTPHR